MLLLKNKGAFRLAFSRSVADSELMVVKPAPKDIPIAAALIKGGRDEDVGLNLLLRYWLDGLRKRGRLRKDKDKKFEKILGFSEHKTLCGILKEFRPSAMRGRGAKDAPKAFAGWLCANLRAAEDPGICKFNITEVGEMLGMKRGRHHEHCTMIRRTFMHRAPLPGQKGAAASEAARERQNRIWCEKKGGTFLPESPAASAALTNVHEGPLIAPEFDPCQALIEKEEPGKAFRPKLPASARQT